MEGIDGDSYTDGGFGSCSVEAEHHGNAGVDNSFFCHFSTDRDDQPNWSQESSFSNDKPDNNLTYITDEEIFQEDDTKKATSHDDPINSALHTESFAKEIKANENGEAPMSSLLSDPKEETDEAGEGCGPIDFLYYSLVCCCTIM